MEPPLQQAAERQRDARDPEERNRNGDQDHKRDDRQEDQGEPQQGDGPDGEQKRRDARGERDLDSTPAFQPLDRESRPVGKKKQHGQREEHESGAIAKKSGKRVQRANRAQRTEWRSSYDIRRTT